MTWFRATVLAGVSAALLIGACLAAPTESTECASAAGEAVTAKGVSATLSVMSDWGAGYCASVTLTNGSSAAVTTWHLALNGNGSTISQLWNGTYTQNGTLVAVDPLAYDAALPPRRKGSFGFCGTGTGRATLASLTLDGGSRMAGPAVVELGHGSWRIFMDGQGSTPFVTAMSSDLYIWSAWTPLPRVGNLVRHGTVIRN